MAMPLRNSKYFVIHATIVTVALLMASQSYSAVSPNFCSRIESLLDHSTTNFTGIAVTSGQDSSANSIALQLTGAESCSVTSQLEGKSYHCVWKYPYRAEAALAAFSQFNEGIQACIGDRAELHNDPDVNHPDFYDLRIYKLDHAKVSVSVKDKSALDSTFVFIRISP